MKRELSDIVISESDKSTCDTIASQSLDFKPASDTKVSDSEKSMTAPSGSTESTRDSQDSKNEDSNPILSVAPSASLFTDTF